MPVKSLRAGAGSVALAWTVLLACAAPATAQLPGARLYTVFPLGAEAGTTREITLGGADLDDVAELRFSHPGLQARPKLQPAGPFDEGPQASPGVFELSVDEDVPEGAYEVWAVGRYGVSNPRQFVVSRGPESQEVEPNNERAQATPAPLETGFSGRIDGGADVDWFKITARKGERILIRCQAKSLDSRLDPAMTLFDGSGRELQTHRDASGHDLVLDLRAPADGEYFVKLHDFVYSGGGEYFYRLTASTRPYVDFVWPPVVVAGRRQAHTLFGRNLPGGAAAEGLAIEGQPLEQAQVTIDVPVGAAADPLAALLRPRSAAAFLDLLPYRLRTPQGDSNQTPLALGRGDVVAEQEPNDRFDAAQQIAVPAEFAGRFQGRRDRDWLKFEAKAGDVFWLSLASDRLGQPTDPFFVIRSLKTDEQGKPQLADVLEADDLPERPGGREFPAGSVDAQARFAVPADGTYLVAVQDRAAANDPRSVYWLSIHREAPDFALVAKAARVRPDPRDNNTTADVWQPLVRSGGADALQVLVERRDGFDGPIELEVEGLPAGVRAEPAVVAPGQNTATIVLSAAAGAPAWSGPVEVLGRARIGDSDVVRAARKATLVWPCRPNDGNMPPAEARLTAALFVSVSGNETAPFVAVPKGAVAELAPGGQVTVPFTIERRGDFKGNVVVSAQRLPPNLEAEPVTVNADQAEGALVLKAKPDAPVGEFNLVLAAVADAAYARNPEAAQRAAERKTRLEAKVAELTAASQKQTEAQAATTTAAASAAEQLAAATTRQTEAAARAADLAAKLKTADEARAAAEAASVEAAAKAKAAAEVLAAVTQHAADAKAAAEAAAQAQQTATAALDTARQQSEAAAQAKTQADQATAAAAATLQAATDARAAAEKRANELAEAAKPQNVKVAAPVAAPRLRLLSAPVKLGCLHRMNVPSGGQAEFEVSLVRLPGFADAVELSLVPPDGVAGLPAAKAQVPGDQSAVKLAIAPTAETPAGAQRYELRASVKQGDKTLEAKRPVWLVFEPAAAKP